MSAAVPAQQTFAPLMSATEQKGKGKTNSPDLRMGWEGMSGKRRFKNQGKTGEGRGRGEKASEDVCSERPLY